MTDKIEIPEADPRLLALANRELHAQLEEASALLRDVLEDYEIMARVDAMQPDMRDHVVWTGQMHGYGAMMGQCSSVWRDHLAATGAPTGGEFCVGPCRDVVEQVVTRLRAVLGDDDEAGR